MKKKSWIFSLMLALIMLPCIMLLSACGGTKTKVTSVDVYIGETLASDSNNLQLTYGDTLNLESRITVKVNYDNNTSETITSGTKGYTYQIKKGEEVVSLSNPLVVGTYSVE